MNRSLQVTSPPAASEVSRGAGWLAGADRGRVIRINAAIRHAARSLRARHPVLEHQDAIGLSILLGSAGAFIAAAEGYVHGVLPPWATVLVVALATSIAHEVEHDLIHFMYFREHRVVNAAMMALAWLLRPNTINPWVRRGLHLHHHRMSGTATDLEERAITNGESFGVRRLVMMADGVAAVLLRMRKAGGQRGMILAKFLAGYFPMGWIHFGLWYSFLVVHAVRLVAGGAAPFGATPWLDAAVVIWIAPNVLRSFCLNFVSSNVHYFGDVTVGNVLEQTQVLDSWLLLPMQIFCFNFGGTHAIHHFVASEPFYVRQWTAAAVLDVLRDNGVRFNDFGTFRRANRRFERRGHEPATGGHPSREAQGLADAAA